MKILLVVPNFKWSEWDINTLWNYTPYNLCLLASMVRDIVEVEILDANINNFTYSKFKKEIKKINPDIVGITVLMNQYSKSGHIAAKLTKEVNKKIKVILGGVYATINSNEAIRDINIDYIVIGEGEYILRDLIYYFNNNGELPKNGICYRDRNKIINLGHSDFIDNLDELPLPSYDLIDYNKYIYIEPRKSIDGPLEYPYARIITSRGCPVGCSFCQVQHIMGRLFRKRSTKEVIKEIKYLIDNYNIKSITFDDDNVIMDRNRAIELFKEIKKLNIVWAANAIAAFKLDEELLTIMKESGCKYIDIAIESGSERILKDIIKKPVKLHSISKIVSYAKNLGIFVSGNFMIEFPTETWEEIRTTIKFAEESGIDYIKIYVVIPLRNTELWNICEKHKLFKKNFKETNIRWSTGQVYSKEFTSNDLTILRAYEWDRINFSSKEKIKKVMERMKVTEDELFKIRKDTINNVSKILDIYE